VLGLVLAAGAGTRLGRPKAAVAVGGERLVDRAVRTLVDGGCDGVLVVAGAEALEVGAAEVVDNPDWQEGVGSSLRTGLRAAAGRGADAVVVLLVDQPDVRASDVQSLVAARRSGAGLAVTGYGRGSGHPVLLGAEHWDGASALAAGDVGARAYLRVRSADVRMIDSSQPDVPPDIDTPDDLAAAEARAAGGGGGGGT